MRWAHLIAYAALLPAWAALALWQWHEYGHERELAEDTLHRQAEAVMNALVGGIRTHRRLGCFFEEHFQKALGDVVASKDVLAAAVASDEGDLLLAAPKEKAELLGVSPAIVPGESWEAAGFRLVAEFQLSRDSSGQCPNDEGRPGGGLGRGRGPRWRAQQSPEDIASPFAGGGKFFAVLLLDRTGSDDRCRRAAWLRTSVVVAGTLVLVCVTLVWQATVRLTETRGRARLLETEARHLRELSQASAGLAHETRNPLGLIRGWTQRLAQSDLKSEEQKRQARAVIEECDRVTSRINQFLAFARPCEPRLEPVHAAEVVDELAALLEPDLNAKNLTLRPATEMRGETIQADREMLRQALFNLVQNAIQSTPEGEAVEIAVRNGQDGHRRIEVADRGPGVLAHAVGSLFTPYFTTRADGTGLGLAIVRRIAAAHGWQAGYTPRDGGGSVFWLDQVHG